ncbi:MAG: hypothetical protein QOE86_1016 [Solirubrobacteraceae bacterium]|nr:hypothetical protein [Solirubrobacteraceae bacterium]
MGLRAVRSTRLGDPWLWIGIAIACAVALRLPYLDAALTRDEGGDTLIALAFSHAGPFVYGPYFLDRPPLLLGLYGLAATVGGDVGIRWLGVLAAASGVVLITLLAVRLAGRAAAPFAALAGCAMLSSQAIGAEQTPAELLAVVPSCGSVLLLVTGLQRRGGPRWWFAGAGAAAAAAILVKQSFGDALAAGLAGLVAAAVVGAPRRRQVTAAALAYGGGVAAVLAGLAVWAWAAGATLHELWFAMAGFRLDAFGALSQGRPVHRLLGLGQPAFYSGVAIGVAAAIVAITRLRAAPGVRVALAAWLAAGVAGVTLSGSYYPPYLIELVPVSAIGIALGCARRPAIGIAVGLVAVGAALLPTARAAVHDSADSYEARAEVIGHYVRGRAEPGQTAYVLYARANALYYTGLPSPYPYHWALMMRAIPAAPGRLRALIASDRRPTWIIRQNRPGDYGLDARGRSKALLRRYYRPVARVCGTPILLARGSGARPAPRSARHCPGGSVP